MDVEDSLRENGFLVGIRIHSIYIFYIYILYIFPQARGRNRDRVGSAEWDLSHSTLRKLATGTMFL